MRFYYLMLLVFAACAFLDYKMTGQLFHIFITLTQEPWMIILTVLFGATAIDLGLKLARR